MSHTLTINKKEYVSSAILAARFNYSVDYIGRLAREEKIIGTQIGRQWFIEPHSLEVFLYQAKAKKNIRKEETRRVRKVELGTLQAKLPKEVPSTMFDLKTLAHTLVVVFCGVFVGGLGWVASTGGLNLTDMAQGGIKSIAFIAESITPLRPQEYFSDNSNSFVAASAESVAYIRMSKQVDSKDMIFTVLPEFPERSIVSPHVNSMEEDTGLIFSDDVVVTIDEEGNKLITPIFKNSTSTEPIFLLVPVMRQKSQ